VADEVAAKEKVWDARFDFDKLMRQATRALAERSRALAVAATKKGDVYHAGYANILEIPEFYDIDVTRAVLSMLDETNRLLELFSRSFGEEPIHLLLGDELGYEFLEPCGIVFVEFEAGPERSGSLGVIGPARLNYPRIVPMVRYFGNLIEEIAKEG
jgi:heat-inducible transcriptional repressor